MKDGDMPKIIKEMCAERPEIGALACYFCTMKSRQGLKNHLI